MAWGKAAVTCAITCEFAAAPDVAERVTIMRSRFFTGSGNFAEDLYVIGGRCNPILIEVCSKSYHF